MSRYSVTSASVGTDVVLEGCVLCAALECVSIQCTLLGIEYECAVIVAVQ
jgi:hypothetical protein